MVWLHTIGLPSRLSLLSCPSQFVQGLGERTLKAFRLSTTVCRCGMLVNRLSGSQLSLLSLKSSVLSRRERLGKNSRPMYRKSLLVQMRVPSRGRSESASESRI
uniref:Uncharacterized protein n=1 Tax=Ixodes ricinus TaxID=34613 RepID=A0A6B0UH78_IXORI